MAGSVISIGLAVLTIILYFAGSGLALVTGGIRLVFDLIGMAAGALKPPAPIIAYIIGAVLVRPWYLGLIVGGSFANLIEIPGLIMLARAKSLGADPTDQPPTV